MKKTEFFISYLKSVVCSNSLLGYIFETTSPTINEIANEGGNSVSVSKNISQFGRVGATNLKNGTATKPVTIDAIAPLAVYPFQNKERIIIGQKVAEIPDQPNITNQKTVRSGTKYATDNAIAKDTSDKMIVTIRDTVVISASGLLG